MADIKQAAQWLREGKEVRRASFTTGEGFSTQLPYGFIKYVDNHPEHTAVYTDMLQVEDLLADDWEVMA